MSSYPKRIIKLKGPVRGITVLSADEQAQLVRPDTADETPPPEQIQIERGAFEQELEHAHQRGVEEGRQAGYQQAENEFAEVLKSLSSAIESVKSKGEQRLNEMSESLFDLSLAMVRKIAGPLSGENSGLIVSTLEHVLRDYDLSGNIRVLINPEDYKIADSTARELRQFIPDIKEIGLVSDSQIQRGGCIVETDFGKLDARIDTQLEELRRKIDRTLQSHKPISAAPEIEQPTRVEAEQQHEQTIRTD